MQTTIHYKIALLFSVVLLGVSAYLYTQQSLYWYYPTPIGAWLLFDVLCQFRNVPNTLSLLFTRKFKLFFRFYLAMLALAVSIEVLGSFMLDLWIYKVFNYSTNPFEVLSYIVSDPLVGLSWWLIYPTILMHFRGLYNFIYSFIPNLSIATLLAMALGVLFWEIPNVYSLDWIYTVPYIDAMIFGVNIVVIIGWVFLIQPPVLIYKFLQKQTH